MSETKPAPSEQSDASEAPVDAQEQAEFGAGYDNGRALPPSKGERSDKSDKSDPAATPRDGEAEQPEYVQLTAKDLSELKAAAAKTASYDQQFAKLFGTTGNIQKLLNEQRAQAPAETRKVELPKDAFRDMERNYPELAQQVRSALEQSLSSLPGSRANDADTAKLQALLVDYTTKREIEALGEAYPDWREITGAVDATVQQPDTDNPFRKWLASKDAAYQTKVNNSESAAVLSNAIRLFKRETATAPKPVTGTPRDAARADRIRSAVQPRGDRAGSAGPNTDQDEFEAGFNAGH